LLVQRFDVKDTDEVNWQIVVSLIKRREVLNYFHDIKASGHLGFKKTLSRVRGRFYWPGLQTDVKIYTNGCERCTKRKDPIKTKRAPMGIVISGFPMERIAIDILGDFRQLSWGTGTSW